MYGKDYVYIILSLVRPFYRIHSHSGNQVHANKCSARNILDAADGALTFKNRHIRSDTDVVGISGKVWLYSYYTVKVYFKRNCLISKLFLYLNI